MRALAWFLLLVEVSFGGLAAQNLPPGPWSAPDSITLIRLQHAVPRPTRLRVARDGYLMVLQRGTIDDIGVRGTEGRDSILVEWSHVKDLQVPSVASISALAYGAALGGGIGLAVGLGATRECSGWFDLLCGADAGGVVMATAAFAAAGGLVSAIGSSLGWHTLYSAAPGGGRRTISIAPIPGRGVGLATTVSF